MRGASGLLRHILACNAWNPAAVIPFLVAGRPVGWVRRSQLDMFAGWKDLFSLDACGLCLREPDCPDEASAVAMRTRMLDQAVGHLIESGQLPRRRGEIYPVFERFGAAPLAGLDRAAVAAFGLQAVGVHLNGYVRAPGGLYLWIARRAQNKAVAPGKLDNMVAGGQPLGLSLQDNLIKECGEEAAIPPDLAARAKPVGAVSYCMEVPEGIRRDTLFLYDLDVPVDFVPDNVDGEHEAFFLLSVADIVGKLRHGDEFKFNVPLVIVDFMIRHGIIDAGNEPDYLDLLKGLRQ